MLPGRSEGLTQLTVSQQLELIAHGITAVLATWLGLTVFVRSRDQRGAPVFGGLMLLLGTWSVSIMIQRLTGDPAVLTAVRPIEIATAYLLPVATLHIALAISVEGRRTSLQHAGLIMAYAISAVAATLPVIDPALEFRVTPPHFSLPGIPGEAFGWGWIIARIIIFLAAAVSIVAALPGAGMDLTRRRQLQVAMLTIVVGAVGAVLRFLPGPADSDPWLGVSLISLATIMTAYAVFAQGIFLAPDVAGKAFRYSLSVGAVITVYVALLVGLERLTQHVLAIELPLITTLALVVTIALFDPIADRIRQLLAGSSHDAAYDRLLRALGQNILTAQRPERAIEPALARLCRAFRLSGAVANGPDAEPMAHHGHVPDNSPLTLRMALRSGDVSYGDVAFGPKRSQLPFTSRETELLGLAATYLAASLRLSARQDKQAEALDALSVERAELASTGSVLQEALNQTSPATDGPRLQVFALGPLRVQRGTELMRQWGGEKAGTRQAEALFAFLFDRGERGVAKDEATELIWPDVEIDRADLAFHRTLGGLRRTLEPQRRRNEGSTSIVFHNDRYRLDPGLIAWSDVDAFADRLADASGTTDADAALGALGEARALYRGDYLDDCPFYGDSAQVEDRRELLRARYVDLLLALGERYEVRGDRGAAAAAFREARLAAGDDCPPAEAALARLGTSVP